MIKIGIIGVGRFGRLHLNVFKQIPNCEVVAIADIDLELVKKVAQDYHIKNYYADPLDLIRSDVDVIDIVTDENMHGKLALDSLKHNKHVFVEKPLATATKEAEQIYDLAKTKNKNVMVGNISRFALPYIKIKRILEREQLGTLGQIRVKRNFSKEWFQQFGKRVHPVYESGIHDIDLILWYAESKCKTVYSVERKLSNLAFPDLFSSVLTFENGLVVSLDSSWCVPKNAPQNCTETLELDGTIDAEIELIGNLGTVKFNLLDTGVKLWTDEQVIHPDFTLWPTSIDMIGGAIRDELQHFIMNIEKKQESVIAPLLHSVEALQIAEAIAFSGAENRVIHLK
nr:Gfo/Idh/MocA family oxidoreductase [Fredinandcohnia onubensis]